MDNKTIHTSLTLKKSQLLERIAAIEADLRKGCSQDFSEQTTESENDEVLDEIHHEAKLELSLVNQAIQRIEQNKYGSCSNCDEPINAERLMALPYINTCINCAQ